MTNSFFSLALGITIFSFLISSVLIVPFINLLYKFRLTRRKEGAGSKTKALFDKLHDIKAGTPVGGGLIIIAITSILFGILFPISARLGVFVHSAYRLNDELWVVLVTFLSFGILGAVDDFIKIFGKPVQGRLGMLFGLRKGHKFALQWILGFIVAYMIYANLGIRILYIPLLGITLNLGFWYLPFAALIIVFFANAFNITDGLDGLASGLLLICLMAFSVIAAGNLDTPISIFVAIWSGALIAFLYFNIYPARIFMGDAGAMSFGATLAVIGLLTGSIVALIVMGGIFVVELLSSAIQIIGWRFLKRPIFPLAPIHHAFLAVGWEEPKIVMRAWIVGIMLAIFGLWLATI